MLGKFVPIGDVDIASIKVSLTKDNELIVSSVDANPIDIRKSLKWLIKKSYLEGYNLKSGTIYLTGSLVNPVIMKKAMYQIDYNQMKDISLVVR